MIFKTMPKLENVTFKAALLLTRLIPGTPKPREIDSWNVIGTYGNQLFMLHYQNGYTQWTSALDLTENIRRKILNVFKTELRDNQSLPDYVAMHGLEKIDASDFKSGCNFAHTLYEQFNEYIWLKKFNNIEYVTLHVPYEDSRQVKSLGAEWNQAKKTWRVNKNEDLTRFKDWLQPKLH